MGNPAGNRIPVLYITYDGLLDPLGGSQILPYLLRIARFGVALTVLSFEKHDRFAAGGQALARQLEAAGIEWRPLRFTRRGGAAGKAWDLARMYARALALAVRRKVRVVHARGMPPAMAARWVKRLTGAAMIFDLRGFWVDERVDKGGWDLSRPLDRLQYNHFKRTERSLLAATDGLIVLTDAALRVVKTMGLNPDAVVRVIPCCADFEHFPLVDREARGAARAALGLPEDALVLGYLGSIGQMYLPERFLEGFAAAARSDAKVHALVITPDAGAAAELVASHVPADLQARVRVRSASREQVPQLIAALSVLVNLVRPSPSRVGMSPTKLAECLATGLPVICNSGIGDVAEQVAALDAGAIVDPFSDHEFVSAVAALASGGGAGGERLRNAARQVFGLEVAEARYREIYAGLDAGKGTMPC
jgi:glycosyltransferase involved in cell wall biosynthesis